MNGFNESQASFDKPQAQLISLDLALELEKALPKDFVLTLKGRLIEGRLNGTGNVDKC